ncbi:MAG TPA: zf-TFIIB domain-containing protein [Armatimonadota bacterium]|nr:zf-TFIIB domain-containing protein [Armatimonadota bacterium]
MRILAMCPNCGTQIDASGRATGEQVSCRCGALITVPEPRATEARVVRCPNCGAARSGDTATCEFCQTRFSLADKGWGSICPSCFCRLPLDASFCVECGLKIDPVSPDELLAHLTCPRCASVLNNRLLGKLEVSECGGCGGLWLPVGRFEAICKDEETMGALNDGLSSPERSELAIEDSVRYMHCPKCHEIMNRQNFARISGVLIDSCRDCGAWFDNQELNKIVRFLQTGGMKQAHELEAQERLLMAGSAPPNGIWSDTEALGITLSMNLNARGHEIPPDAHPLLRTLVGIVNFFTKPIV